MLLTKDHVRDIIRLALAEDLGRGDVTSDSIFTEKDTTDARIVAKQEGIYCGSPMIEYVYSELDNDIAITVNREEGGPVQPGDTVATITGSTRAILSGERTVLNFIQRMSGIATRTRHVVDLLQGTGIQILDTRKTAPGLRIPDKYAVACGGGSNHRMGLFDMVMIKDNHIRAAGGITAAVEMVRKKHGNTYQVEVETTTLEEVEEAVEAGADIIMLDNMDTNTMIEAVNTINGRARSEVSGNMDEKKILALRNIPVDYISMGGLTHSVTAFDLSMKFL